MPDKEIVWLPDLLYVAGRFESDLALVCDVSGRIVRLARNDELTDEKRIPLPRRAILPGMVNAHSHAFQRVLRGRTEYRTSNRADSFWTWRETMYSAATRLTPEDIYDASRMAFLEMALGGITAVGEFHYLHNAPAGRSYDDPAYLRNLEGLIASVSRGSVAQDSGALTTGRANAPHATAWVGVAPHSVRAVSLDYLREVIAYANERALKVHMHVAEQPAEVSACIEEYGRTPIALLQSEALLSERFTAVHAIHVTPKAIPSFGKSGAIVCACPTTERNLGDGVVPADEYFKHGVPMCLGTDSHAQIDLLEDARELEYHLRLQKLERAVLSATALFDCATINGARSIGAPGGALERGMPADFFTVDLDDPSIAGASQDDLLASTVFTLSRAAVREVVVGGKPIVSEGQHLIQEEVVERFNQLQKKLWS